MIKNYFKIAWRNLWKHKLFSMINVFGLAMSLAVCMLVMTQLKEDLSYDLFHPNPNKTFRILSNIVEKGDGEHTLASTPLPLAEELSQVDQVKNVVQIYPAIYENATYEGKRLPIKGAFTSAAFFDVFGFSLSSGNQTNALEISNGIILSSETAKRYFGNSDPIGKLLDFQNLGLFQVTGVLAKAPGKSHLDFDVYASLKAIPALEASNKLPAKLQNWDTFNDSYTYVELKENVSESNLNSILEHSVNRPEFKESNGEISFIPQKLTSITPGTDGIYNEIGKGTVWAKVWTIVGIGLIILLAAGFNYTNLTLARALTRAKEVGIRKISGASRFQIFTQYIVESVLISILALSLAFLGLLQYNPGFRFEYFLIVLAILFTILVGTAAGAFPAWILSSFKPVKVLKSLSTQKLLGNLSLKKGLLVFQFSLSLAIIVFLSAYYQQFTYVATIDPGFQSNNIITMPIASKDNVFINEISKLNGVEKVSRISNDFGMRGSGSIEVFKEKPSNQQGISLDYYYADAAAFDLFGLQILAGNNFPISQNNNQEKFVLLNEKAVKSLGYKTNHEAVGNSIYLKDSVELTISGIVKDFFDKGAARDITPTIFRNMESGYNYLSVLVNQSRKDALIPEIKSIWKNLYPNTSFEYQWLDKKIEAREDQGEAYTIMGFLAFITITIAAMGLLGLVIYTVETRQKEISIRKIIGASVNQLMLLLSKGFLKLLFISGLIALPIGYLVSYLFLQNFANKVSFGIGSLLICFLFLLSIGLITILSNTYRAATANPADNITQE